MVFDESGRLLFSESIELAVGESVRRDLRMDFLDQEFEIVDAEGAPFNGVWEEDGVRYRGPVEFCFRSNDVACASARSAAEHRRRLGTSPDPGPEAAWDEDGSTPPVLLRDPEVIEEEREAAAARPSGGRVTEVVVAQGGASTSELELQRFLQQQAADEARAIATGASDDRLDHPRGELESLDFPPLRASPRVVTVPLDASGLGQGRYAVRRVPIQADRVLVTVGPYSAPLSLDLIGWNGAPLEVELVTRCNATSAVFVGSISCFDCHSENGVAEMTY